MAPTLTYENDLAEAAWLTSQDVSNSDYTEGLSASRGGQPGDAGWEGYVTVNLNMLSDRGHAELAADLRADFGISIFAAWITTNGKSVALKSWGHDEGLRSGTDMLWQAWQEQN
ncbi:hypothetical protein MUG78_18000 [Gordonia alkaliphila]|uniref:hypothetical protein n=1 Tax=Gordonia alkaliphila TaxID=1053547 RepID=UPI001FF21F1E|nr:hypothetical protein [Gordonia alkaliphila]MCK0441294.1 hypothetical protein [Gordonia alkaliphila]